MSKISQTNLRIPGPTPVTPEILNEMSRFMINHRGDEFRSLIESVTARLKTIYQTNQDLYILTASGTGAMETAIVNTLSPGDSVLAITIGAFGDRFANIAETYGANVEILRSKLGEPADPDKVKAHLNSNPNIKAVLVTHNESWKCDAVASASQKGWMAPPGLAFLSFSLEAWKANSYSNMPRFYFDLREYKKYMEIGQPPWTPNLSLFFALDKTLDLMLDEGVPNIHTRHTETAQKFRDVS
jgi:aspartate aminotransferase-like enzyme